VRSSRRSRFPEKRIARRGRRAKRETKREANREATRVCTLGFRFRRYAPYLLSSFPARRTKPFYFPYGRATARSFWKLSRTRVIKLSLISHRCTRHSPCIIRLLSDHRGRTFRNILAGKAEWGTKGERTSERLGLPRACQMRHFFE